MAEPSVEDISWVEPAHPPFLEVAVEILDLIIERLSNRDLKALRLACRSFVPSTTRLLFRSICISKTKLDRENFFNISQAPHLAILVREIIWYELHADETAFCEIEDESRPVLQRGLTGEDNTTAFELPCFSKLARNAFWWPSPQSSIAFREQHTMEAIEKEELSRLCRKGICEEFNRLFLSALDDMPNIHSFACYPMPPLHVISNTAYPMTAQLLQQNMWTIMDDDNDLYNFLIPAMQCGGIRRLAFPDQGVKSTVEGRLSVASVFRHLTHLDLCLQPARLGQHLARVHIFLGFATSLEVLRIRLEQRGTTRGRLRHPLGSTSEGILILPRLRKLELTDYCMASRTEGVEVMFRFLKLNCPSLRHVVFHRCSIPGRLLKRMSHIADLDLSSLIITEFPGRTLAVVGDAELLVYVNGSGPLPEELKGHDDTVICTRQSRKAQAADYQRWRLSKMSDTAERITTAEHLRANTTGYGSTYPDEVVELISDFLHSTALRSATTPAALGNERSFQKVRLVEGGTDLKTQLSIWTPEISRQWTKHWLFIHSDGRQAIGDDPLEFFSDWEDSQDEGSDYEGSDDEGGDETSGSQESDDDY